MSVVSQILGETTTAGGIPAVDMPALGTPMKVGLGQKRRRLNRFRTKPRIAEDDGFPPLGMPAASVLYRRKRRAMGQLPPQKKVRESLEEAVLDLFSTPVSRKSIIPDDAVLIWGEDLTSGEESPTEDQTPKEGAGEDVPTGPSPAAPVAESSTVDSLIASLPPGEMPRPDGTILESSTAKPTLPGVDVPKVILTDATRGFNGLPGGDMPPPISSGLKPGYLKFIH